MELSKLIKTVSDTGISLFPLDSMNGADISGISFDSRRCKAGDLFFCKGNTFSTKYAKEALLFAKAICLDESAPYAKAVMEIARSSHPQTPILVTSDIKKAMALCAQELYRHPFSRLKTVAVTGTKGKSTTCKMIRDVLDRHPDIRCALLNDLVPPNAPILTTPEAPDLMLSASEAVRLGYTHLVCEISSQAVKEDRIFGVLFDVGCFLNIGHDHISPLEHKDLNEYFDCKKKILTKCGCVVYNSDCEMADEISRSLRNSERTAKIITFGQSSSADILAKNVTKTAEGYCFTVKSTAPDLQVCLTKGGAWDVYNALCAVSVGQYFGVSSENITRGLLCSHVSGRFETVNSFDGALTVIVAHAHNEMSFDAVFQQARSIGKKMTVVFGCPGNKAKCRRRELPEVAIKYADRIIITDDDSSCEGFDVIRKDIFSHIDPILSSIRKAEKRKILSQISVIPDRSSAIKNAITTSLENGEKRTVLLLGKGADKFMLTENGSAPYEGDLEIAKTALEEYRQMHELSVMIERARLSKEKLTVCIDDLRSAEALISLFPFLPQSQNLAVICPKAFTKRLREACFKAGRGCILSDIYNSKSEFKSEKIRIYTVPENEGLHKSAALFAVNSCSDALVYLTQSRGIMLNKTEFVKRLSLQSARLIEKITETPYLSDMIFALDNGVARCAVIDGSSKLSLARYISLIDFEGSSLVK